MRKLIVLFLCMVMLLSLCACNRKNSVLVEPVNFYYCKEEVTYNSASGVIQPEILEGIEFHNDAETMLRVYLQGPYTNDNLSLLPAQTELVSLKIENDRAYIKLTDAYAQLSGIKLSTASSCIVMTLYDYSGAKEVVFSTENELLDNKDSFSIHVDDLVWLDVME